MITKFEVRVAGVVRDTRSDREEADRIALDIACTEMVDVEVSPVEIKTKAEVVAEMRALLSKANRVITQRRKAGVSVDELVRKRYVLRMALAALEPAGRVEVRRARSTGTLVGLYKSVEGGMESDPDLPWSVVCEDHACLVSTESRAAARSAMACPDDWCPVCRGEDPAPELPEDDS